MSDFSVRVFAVEYASSATRSAGEELSAQLARLRTEADEVLSGQWRGRAAGSFDRCWTEWDAGAREVITALDRLADALAATGRDYRMRDDSSAAMLHRIAL